jgi:methanogenic corrinoid protein MtbC1
MGTPPQSWERALIVEHAIKVLLDALQERGLRDDCFVMIGGEGLDEQTAQSLDVDAFCSVATETKSENSRLQATAA